MKNKFNFINEFNSKLLIKNKFESIEFSIYLIISIIIPFALMYFHFPTQLLVGSIINFSLASGALYFSTKKLIPLIVLPSITAFITGIVFGAGTIFLLYFIPFIWISNALFVYLIKKIKVIQGKNFVLSLSIASLVKSSFLFLIALFFVSIQLVPEIFLISMGFTQLITALIGGTLTGIINALRQ